MLVNLVGCGLVYCICCSLLLSGSDGGSFVVSDLFLIEMIVLIGVVV